MADPFYGEIRTFGFSFAPVNWARCDGTELNIDQYQTLFSVIGSTFGSKNQGVTFSLPNLSGRIAVGTGVGEMVGQETVALDETNQGVHGHGIYVATPPVNQLASQLRAAPGGLTLLCRPRQAFGASQVSYLAYDSTDFTVVPMASNIITPAGSTPTSPHENRQPFLVLNFCICVQGGIYPQQS